MVEESLGILLDQWRSGNQFAATKLFERFYERLLYAVTPRIRPELRRKVQPESVVLFVMEVMLRRIQAGAIPVESSGGFLRVARTIAERRICNQWEYWTAMIRDILLERYGDEEHALPDPTIPAESVAHAAVADLLEKLQRNLPAKLFQVLELSLEGYSQGEIAQKLQVARHTIGRWQKEIARQLESISGGIDEEK